MASYVERIKNNPMALIVKLTDRIHNLSEAILAEESFRKKYIMETEIWYIDLSKNTCFENAMETHLYSLKKSFLSRV